MPNIDLSSGRVHYQEAGQGVPLLLLHANPGDSRDFSAVIPALAAHYRVLALDWPGNGQSPTPQPPGSATALYYYNVLQEFIAALKLPTALFVGNSLGGNAAARLAIEQPQAVKGLVLVSPGGFTPHNFITRSFCRFQGSRFAMPPKIFARLYLRHRSPTVVEMLARAATEQATPERLAVNHAVWRSFIDPEHDLRKSASAIRAPTLLLVGQYDPVIPAKKDGRVAAQAIPGSRLVVPPSGHAPFAEIPEVFLAEVLPFLALKQQRALTTPLTVASLQQGVAELSARDADLAAVVTRFGPPPLWARRPGYTTLAKIILEQQVSQASAAAIYRRLHRAIGGVTQERVLSAGERGLRGAGLTRQKAAYCVGIAQAIRRGELDLRQLGRMDGPAARSALIQVHGIGPWTADVYLLMALRQPDVWPHGDLALAKAVMQVKRLRRLPSYEKLSRLAEQWSPWRAVAARIVWHHYLSSR